MAAFGRPDRFVPAAYGDAAMFLVEALLDIVADLVFATAGGVARGLRLSAPQASERGEPSPCEA